MRRRPADCCGDARKRQSSYDFVSRYFAPAKGIIPEDPVTGGAHCALAPYWAKRLNKTAFRAFQASSRGGEIICRLVGDRVELQGTVVFYMEGEVEIGVTSIKGVFSTLRAADYQAGLYPLRSLTHCRMQPLQRRPSAMQLCCIRWTA